jgi:hypothetical protein
MKYHYKDWKPAFDAIFAAEDDESAAMIAIDRLASQPLHPEPTVAPITQTSLPKPLTHAPQPPLNQLDKLETDLMQSVEDLQTQKL